MEQPVVNVSLKDWSKTCTPEVIANIRKEMLQNIKDMGFRNQRIMIEKPRESNPCREVILASSKVGKSHYMNALGYHLEPKLFRREYPATFYEGNKIMNNEQRDMTPHSERPEDPYGYTRAGISIGGQGLTGRAVVTDDEVVLTIEMPGVDAERVKVRRLDTTLRVRVLPDGDVEDEDTLTQRPKLRELNYLLADYEKVDNVDLDLGVLTIYISRERDIEDYEIY